MRHIVLCSVLALAACQAHQVAPLPAPLSPEGRDHERLGRIHDLTTGEQISPEQLVARLAVADRVLVGEQHDNPDHHALQLWLSRELSARRPQGSVLMEMISPAQQARIARAQQASRNGQAPGDVFETLAWQPGWDWSMYGPLVLYELRQPYPLLAANLDRAEVMDIYRQQPALEGRRSTQPRVQERLLQDIRESHCGMLPESQLPAMLAVQQQRDRRMAESLLAAPEPALLVAGSFHVRKDLGVPLHLADLQADGEQRVLMLAEVGREVTTEAADYVWYTAAQPQQDHCARFAR